MQSEPPLATPTVRPLELPTLPLPKFSGNVWEWDNFWELFHSNVHSQSLSELHKFNYLLNALKGEALEAVKKFQVTRENYARALDFLKNKYGNTEELVFRLIDKLDSCSLCSPAIRDQRKLFEQIQVVVTQLEQKGENVNSQWLIRRILSKFPHGIQRRVLVKKQTLTMDNTFTMDMLFQLLEETISNEEMVTLYTGGNDRSA
ncbi:peptidase family A16 [Ancylostoma ceylanicum]|nr:peptidase family A16 [Ancylostoma ceylanicum]